MCVCVQWWFKKFSEGDESLEDECSSWPVEGDNEKLRAVIEADPFKTTREVAKELKDNHFMVFQHLKWIGKVKRLNKWVPHELTAKKKIIILRCHLLLFCAKQQIISWSDCEVLWQVKFIQLMMTSSVIRPRRSSKALPKSKLAPNIGHGHCLVVSCPSGPLQLPEFWQNHYIRDVCSANQWDALKTTMLADRNGQQIGPSSSPWQCLTTCCTPMLPKLNKLGYKALPYLPYSPDLPPANCHFLKHLDKVSQGKMLPQPAGGRKCFPRVCWILKHRF